MNERIRVARSLARTDPRTDVRRYSRRHALGALGLLGLAGCSSGGSNSSNSTSDTSSGDSTDNTTGGMTASCVLIPEETAGPYPLWTDIAAAAIYQRSDITEARSGVPLRLTLRLVNVNDGCSAITNAMVYVWHCDKDGLYSGYNQPGGDTTGETFCRGVQTTGSGGEVTFLTIYPGWYSGRITHVHFRIYLGNDLGATSQLAFPPDVTNAVYDSELYSERGQNDSVGSFASDNVFSDGTQYQMCTVTEDASTGGYDASLVVGIIG